MQHLVKRRSPVAACLRILCAGRFQLDDSGRVSVYGAVCFGGTILVCECLICAYVHYAHKKVIAGMGSVNGFRGMDKVLQVSDMAWCDTA